MINVDDDGEGLERGTTIVTGVLEALILPTEKGLELLAHLTCKSWEIGKSFDLASHGLGLKPCLPKTVILGTLLISR